MTPHFGLMPASPENRPGWLEIAVDIDPVCHEALSAFLFDLGCDGVVSEGFHDFTLKAYLPDQIDLENTAARIDAFLQKLEEIFPEIQAPERTFSKIEDQDWSRNWRRFFHAERVTEKLLVLPAWEGMPSNAAGLHVIRLDPGPAFGTGYHATTRMCLEAMERVLMQVPWAMLDVGTGTGILAMYGAILGASRVMAVDIDPEAVRWARKNIELNDLPAAIELSSIPLEKISDRFPLIVANLVLGTIVKLLGDFARVSEPGGWLVLSGILNDQEDKVHEALAGHGFGESQALYKEEWVCLIVRKCK